MEPITCTEWCCTYWTSSLKSQCIHASRQDSLDAEARPHLTRHQRNTGHPSGWLSCRLRPAQLPRSAPAAPLGTPCPVGTAPQPLAAQQAAIAGWPRATPLMLCLSALLQGTPVRILRQLQGRQLNWPLIHGLMDRHLR